MTDNIDINEIQKLQDFYLKFCEDNLLNDLEIHAFCKNAQNEINNNYEDLYAKTTRPNLISTPFERLVTFHIISYFFKKNINIKLAPSIISSDLIFELDDCYINIDCKTVNILKNPGDAKDISVSPNQMTFQCPPLYKTCLEDETVFSGFHYEGHQNPIKNFKPNFTFMFKLVYADNYSFEDIKVDQPVKNAGISLGINNLNQFKKRSYKNLSLAIACVPNGLLIDENTRNNILQGFKTYEYITSTKNYHQKYKPLDNKKNSWIEIKLKNIEKKKKLVFYLDKTLKHPNYHNEHAVRALQKNKYCIILGGDAARLNRDYVNFKKYVF